MEWSQVEEGRVGVSVAEMKGKMEGGRKGRMMHELSTREGALLS